MDVLLHHCHSSATTSQDLTNPAFFDLTLSISLIKTLQSLIADARIHRDGDDAKGAMMHGQWGEGASATCKDPPRSERGTDEQRDRDATSSGDADKVGESAQTPVSSPAERMPQISDFSEQFQSRKSLTIAMQSRLETGELTLRPAEDLATHHLHRMKHHVTPLLKHVTPVVPSKPSLIQGSISKETAIATHARIHGISAEKEQTLRELYDRLDMDNDGTIDIRDLTAALAHQMPHIPASFAPKLIASMDPAKKNTVDFGEFVLYVLDHEKQLELVFHDLDRNKDGFIDVAEIKDYCSDLGIPISDSKARNIVERILEATELHPDTVTRMRMDRTGSAAIDLSEFQQFMLFCPSTDPRDIADFWRHNLVIDIGEDLQIPEDFSPLELQSGVWWRHLVAGGMAGCMSRTCTAPLDRIKVFLQVYATRQNRMNLASAVRQLYKEGGVQGFWRGNGINVIKIAPESAIKFMAYEQIKRVIQRIKGDSQLTIYERFLAGSSAGAISQTVIYPMEVLKTRLALRRTGELEKGLAHFAAKLYRQEGFACFYKGYTPNLLGIIPYAGIDLAIYETLKGLYREHSQSAEPGVLAVLACGTCSSTCGQLATYPLALVRTRLQARSAKHLDQPDSMSGQFRRIVQNEGVRGLYRGIAPNFAKVIPAVSISYVVYENVRKRLGATMS